MPLAFGGSRDSHTSPSLWAKMTLDASRGFSASVTMPTPAGLARTSTSGTTITVSGPLFAPTAGAEVWAYCLMPNHVHLIVTPRDEDGLRATLAEAHRRYTGAINARFHWTGHPLNFVLADVVDHYGAEV